MSLHDEMEAALDEWCGERAEVSADAEEAFRAILARHPECKPEPVDLQSGDSNASEVLTEISGEQVNLADIITESLDAYLVHGNSEDATLSQAVIRGHYLATALAGYRNRPMPSVDEVLGIADNITARRSIGLYSGLSDNTRRIANAAAREAATAVLALFTKESE